MSDLDKIFVLNLLGCETINDNGRYYAKGGYVKKYQDKNQWVNINNIIIDWNFVIELAKVVNATDKYEDNATFFDCTFLGILDSEDTPDDVAQNLISCFSESYKDNDANRQ